MLSLPPDPERWYRGSAQGERPAIETVIGMLPSIRVLTLFRELKSEGAINQESYRQQSFLSKMKAK